jgi:hypothetical protein
MCAASFSKNGANTVVNGVRENFNGFLINGMSNTSLSGGPVNTPILDTVQEVQVLTLNNSAEFGSSAGAITNLVSKSGTNQLHGSAWEFVRNEIFDANPFFANHVPDPADRKRLPVRSLRPRRHRKHFRRSMTALVGDGDGDDSGAEGSATLPRPNRTTK